MEEIVSNWSGKSFYVAILLRSQSFFGQALGNRSDCAKHNQHVRHANVRVCGDMSPGKLKIDALRLNLGPL